MSAQLAAVPERSAASQRRQAVVIDKLIVHRLMSVEELAAWLNLTIPAIRMMVSRARHGKAPKPIPFFQPGGKGAELRFDYDEILRWMRGGCE